MRYLFVPVGLDMAPRRLQLLQKKLEQSGNKVKRLPCTSQDPKRVGKLIQKADILVVSGDRSALLSRALRHCLGEAITTLETAPGRFVPVDNLESKDIREELFRIQDEEVDKNNTHPMKRLRVYCANEAPPCTFLQGRRPTAQQLRVYQRRHKFAFMRKDSGPVGDAADNSLLIETFQRLERSYTSMGEHWRSFAAQKAVRVLKSLTYTLTTEAQVDSLSGVGARSRDKMKELLATNECQRLAIENDKKVATTAELASVWGLGLAKADELFRQGVRSLDELRRRQDDLLNDKQRYCLEHHVELSLKMSRSEVEEIFAEVQAAVHELFTKENATWTGCSVKSVTCGSYRRGRESSGDVDILMTCLDKTELGDELHHLVNHLKMREFVCFSLTSSDHTSSHGSQSWMGVIRHRGHLRRMDIKAYPLSQWSFALLHFTGSAIFNRSLRLYARHMGLSLSDHGLCPVLRRGGDKTATGQPFACRSEAEIFECLGVPYREAPERDLVQQKRGRIEVTDVG
ncbi:MAG: hypothetical protein KVP17_004553 [Porospora cf. gigantea B]|uniref:uncharacterized protein n=2 Tax=Porospora cf. gigantea B TaxID=2853592 RepID=UPI0035717F45|nr:MAG: hypothetical protein KVP17_004553 [Porospora cf. gigantea B]